MCGQDHDTGCALRPRMALCGEGSVVSIRNLSMRGLLDARDRSRGAHGDNVCHCLWGAGESGSASDCGTVADSDPNANPDRDLHVHADTDGDRNALPNANADRNSHVHARSDFDSHVYADTLSLVFAARAHGICLVVMG